MSLRAFHILFIALTSLLAAGCAAWGFVNGLAPIFGIICVVICVALLAYGVYFFRKSRKLIL